MLGPTSRDITGAMCGPKRTEPFIALMEIEEAAQEATRTLICPGLNSKRLGLLLCSVLLVPFNLHLCVFCHALKLNTWQKVYGLWLYCFALSINAT